MNKSFTINGTSFEETITRLEDFMDRVSGEDFTTLRSARDFVEWLQEESKINE